MSRISLLSQSRTGTSIAPDSASVRAGFPDGRLHLLGSHSLWSGKEV